MGRYAVYFVPRPTSTLGAFGIGVLGYDAETGRDAPFHAELECVEPGWSGLVAEPARYGFHATLKAPFTLREGVSETMLLRDVEAVAQRSEVCFLGNLSVAPLGRFIALVPGAAPAALTVLEAALVRGLTGLGAPLSDADRARRLSTPLTARQARYLDAWGYPYVLEEFRFHMTLAGPIPPERMDACARTLARLYEPHDRPVTVAEIAVLHQPSRSERFRVLARFALGQRGGPPPS